MGGRTPRAYRITPAGRDTPEVERRALRELARELARELLGQDADDSRGGDGTTVTSD